ncbi:MAG: hypothetical protein U1E51_22940, partial [Candidatus Binatia bacterium]|nr:hypothetical protein [Candidatus Binatia bacterium]
PAFIAEMKQKLLDEQGQITKELKVDARDDHGDYQAIYPEYGRHEDENASEIADYTALNAATEALEKRLEEIQTALERVNNGTYGITSHGQLIPENRLRANPAATTLVNVDK